MPIKYVCEKTGNFLDNQAVRESGAPRAYGIKTVEDLVSMCLSIDKQNQTIFRAKL